MKTFNLNCYLTLQIQAENEEEALNQMKTLYLDPDDFDEIEVTEIESDN